MDFSIAESPAPNPNAATIRRVYAKTSFACFIPLPGTPPIIFSAGTITFSKVSAAVFALLIPCLCSCSPLTNPLEFPSTMKNVGPSGDFASIEKNSAKPPFEINCLLPFNLYQEIFPDSSLIGSAFVFIASRLLPASDSVTA